MKKSNFFIASLLAVALSTSGCSRNNAPTKDAAGVAPTGNTLTVKITGDVSKCRFEYARNSSEITSSQTVSLPYEETFNVKSGESFFFLTDSTSNRKSPKDNVRLVVYYNGDEVASGVESPKKLLPNVPTAYTSGSAYTTP